MKPELIQLPAGLYLVATPIGNARDITLRALDILASADVIAAEDTRTARKLLGLYGLSPAGRPLIAYHDHSGAAGREGILKLVRDGRSVAYVSEAGMPLIADPGYALARAITEAGHRVSVAPGASAVLTALSLSGLPSDRFLFAGFAPSARNARRKWLREVAETPATLVLFESARRIKETLVDLCEIAGDKREAAICRELTKKFEEVIRAPLGELRDQVAQRTLKGEIVLVIGRGDMAGGEIDMHEALKDALQTMRVKDAAAHVADLCRLPRRTVYQAALELNRKGNT